MDTEVCVRVYMCKSNATGDLSIPQDPCPPRFVFEKESLTSLDLTKSAGPAVQAVLEVTCLHFPALPSHLASHLASSHVYLNSMQVLMLPNAQRRFISHVPHSGL